MPGPLSSCLIVGLHPSVALGHTPRVPSGACRLPQDRVCSSGLLARGPRSPPPCMHLSLPCPLPGEHSPFPLPPWCHMVPGTVLSMPSQHSGFPVADRGKVIGGLPDVVTIMEGKVRAGCSVRSWAGCGHTGRARSHREGATPSSGRHGSARERATHYHSISPTSWPW